MPAREELKILLVKENMTIAKVAQILSTELDRNISADNLSQRLRKGTFRYNEMEIIAKKLGYRIVFEKENK